MNRVISSIDAYLSSMVDCDNSNKNDADEEEALVLRDLCMICNCTLDSDIYEDGLFYDDTKCAYHLSCKCKLHAHQTCIDNYINCESLCPQCEKPLEKAPFLKQLWNFFVRFFDSIR